MDSKKIKFDSKLIHSGMIDDQYGPATVPIYQTSTFKFNNADHGADLFAGNCEGFIYSRMGNPTVCSLERLIADLENGYKGIALSSGMGAVNTIFMGLLETGSHIVSTDAIYGATRVVIENHYSRFGVEADFVDTTDCKNIIDAIKPNTKLIYIETPANPTMGITDIEKVVEIAREKGIITVVDNTFCSPYLQKPLDLGVDIVFHSVTKFINGHADIVGGVIVTREKELHEKLNSMMANLGCNMDPHQAYMVIRGVKTLSIRIEQSQKNAMKIAKYLENHPKVKWVNYPGLDSFSQKELVKKQMSGPGAMIAFELKEGYNAGKTLMNNVKLCILAVSLGGVESLIQHPASMTHSKVDKDSREKAGITNGLVRLSVGIENVDDLIADLDQALNKI